MPATDPADSISLAEQALRDVVVRVMTDEHGNDWAAIAVSEDVRKIWTERRAAEARQRAGHTFAGTVSDLNYADLGHLKDIVLDRRFVQLFESALGPKDETRVLLDVLLRARRPVAHTRPLLPFEQDLASGIAGLLRNRVTIYLSAQSPDGNYYPRIERITDSFGTTFVPESLDAHDQAQSVQSGTTVRVGDTVSFECLANDPQGRELRWRLEALSKNPDQHRMRVTGSPASLSVTFDSGMTGRQAVLIYMSHAEDDYHRNASNTPGEDAVVIFYYRVLPPT